LEGATVLIANYHAPEERDTEAIYSLLRRFGVQDVRIQKDVFNAELYFQLLNIANMGELERMTQYKSSANRTAQLLTYPVLMAHDVAGFDEVFVGEDQRQHLEYARKILNRYCHQYDKEIKIPVERIVVGRIKDLRSPEKKMSKSEPQGCLFLDDSADAIRAKLKKATMDEAGKENLVFLYQEFVGSDIPESNQRLKEELAQAVIEKFHELGRNN
jgi:tyrosyl-tRNA synthetase